MSMAVPFILVFFLSHDIGLTTESIEFNSKAACENALETLGDVAAKQHYAFAGACVPKFKAGK